MSTIKIKAPAMPEPTRQEEQAPFEAWADNYSPPGDCESVQRQWKESSWRESWLQERDAYYRERDAQWQEMYSLLLDELRDAATSLETISRSAGKRWVLDDAGNHVENYLQHPDQIRGYAASRAAVARSALSAITEE